MLRGYVSREAPASICLRRRSTPAAELASCGVTSFPVWRYPRYLDTSRGDVAALAEYCRASPRIRTSYRGVALDRPGAIRSDTRGPSPPRLESHPLLPVHQGLTSPQCGSSVRGSSKRDHACREPTSQRVERELCRSWVVPRLQVGQEEILDRLASSPALHLRATRLSSSTDKLAD